jgi:hypothetical protein
MARRLSVAGEDGQRSYPRAERWEPKTVLDELADVADELADVAGVALADAGERHGARRTTCQASSCRVYRNRSCSRLGLPCQNSIRRGRSR